MDLRGTRLVQQAATAAAAQPELAGIPFDPISLIISLVAPFLSGLFTNCLNPTPTPTPAPLTSAQVKSKLQGAYDQNSGQYSLEVQMPVVTHTMQVARQQGGPVRRRQARVIAIAMLDATRTADDDVVGECLAACAGPAAAMLGDHSEE